MYKGVQVSAKLIWLSSSIIAIAHTRPSLLIPLCSTSAPRPGPARNPRWLLGRVLAGFAATVRYRLAFNRSVLPEKLVAASTFRLGTVHRQVGGAHQAFRVGAVVRIDADADTAAEVQAVHTDDERIS